MFKYKSLLFDIVQISLIGQVVCQDSRLNRYGFKIVCGGEEYVLEYENEGEARVDRMKMIRAKNSLYRGLV